MKTRIIVSAVIGIVTVAGCQRPPDQQAVIGQCSANHGKATDTLQIRSDGSYEHLVVFSDGKVLKNSGRWEYSAENGKGTLTFREFQFGLAGYGTKAPGIWVVTPERSLGGKVRLCIDPDLGYYFIRQS